jgi:hypothetical protein
MRNVVVDCDDQFRLARLMLAEHERRRYVNGAALRTMAVDPSRYGLSVGINRRDVLLEWYRLGRNHSANYPLVYRQVESKHIIVIR